MMQVDNRKPSYILIVDDNMINRKYFSMSLIKSGFRVETAENGSQAICMAQTRLYDVILMDIRMPDLNGFEVSHIIRQTTDNKNTPILFNPIEG